MMKDGSGRGRLLLLQEEAKIKRDFGNGKGGRK